MKDDKRLRRKIRNSYLISHISIALVLFLLGSVGYLTVAAMEVADTLQRSVTVLVELDRNVTDEQREALRVHFADHELVEALSYSSREEKLDDEEFRRMFEVEFEELLLENPLLDSYELTLTARSSERETVDAFIAEAEALPGVDRVSYPAQMAERLHATVAKSRLVLLLFGGALLIISLILLNNTIRLAIYSKRYLINTMKLVGATRWFILRPFLASSISQGVLSGLGATVLFCAAIYGLNEAVPELTSLAEWQRIGAIAGAMILGGVVISACFTTAAVHKFVRMKSNQIHLY